MILKKSVVTLLAGLILQASAWASDKLPHEIPLPDSPLLTVGLGQEANIEAIPKQTQIQIPLIHRDVWVKIFISLPTDDYIRLSLTCRGLYEVSHERTVLLRHLASMVQTLNPLGIRPQQMELCFNKMWADNLYLEERVEQTKKFENQFLHGLIPLWKEISFHGINIAAVPISFPMKEGYKRTYENVTGLSSLAKDFRSTGFWRSSKYASLNLIIVIDIIMTGYNLDPIPCHIIGLTRQLLNQVAPSLKRENAIMCQNDNWYKVHEVRRDSTNRPEDPLLLN